VFFVIALVLIPLVLGYVANLVVGKNKNFQAWETFVAGFIGAFVGAFLVNTLRSVGLLELSLWSVVGLFVGAIIVLAVWGWLRVKVLKSKTPG
jgi:uncharacterized membrane protein YeaQ/YmgE (transglycosylase-associated protein family)